MLRDRFTERLIRQALEDLPETLDETYERIFASIPSHHEGQVKTIMALLAFSTRPMTIQEVAEAVAVDTVDECFAEEDRLRHPCDILELCASLVTLPGVGSEVQTSGCRRLMNRATETPFKLLSAISTTTLRKN